MTKEQFLQSLRERLSGLSRDDCEERLTFYSEMIDDRMEEGLTEEEAVAAVGSADEIAGQIIEEHTSEKKCKKEKADGKLALILAGSPLWFPILLVLGVVAFALWISLWAGVISLWAGFAGICGGAVGGIVGGGVMMAVANVPSGLLVMGCGIACVGLAIFVYFGCREVSKAMTWVTNILIRWCKICFTRKEEAI